MMKTFGFSLLASVTACVLPLDAAEPTTDFQKIEINLWDGPAPGSAAVKDIPEIPFEFITPKLTVFLPAAGSRNGSAVLILPGGGYIYCSAKGEGFEIAEWMAERGVAACVLQYRRNIFQDKTKKETRVYDGNVALEDAVRAMRIIRSNAAEWKLDFGRIGIMGFSAGGHIAACLATHFEKGEPGSADPLAKFSTRPDFMILAYPLIGISPPLSNDWCRDNLLGKGFDPKMAEYLSPQKHVTAETPPCFLVSTSDDFLTEHSIAMYQALKSKKVPCELHIFEKGGHGYGMTKPGLAVTKLWPVLLEEWLKERGVIPAQRTSHP